MSQTPKKTPRQITKSFHTLFGSEEFNEKEFTDLLNNTTPESRQKIREEYKKLYKKAIQKEIINSKMDKKLKEVSLALFDSQSEFDARQINKAVEKLFGADEETINEILASRHKEELTVIDMAYKEFYKISLIKELEEKLEPEYFALLKEILLNPRPNGVTISDSKASQIAAEINQRGILEYVNNADLFRDTFVKKSGQDLVKIAREYNKQFNQSLYDVVKKELSSPYNDLLKKIFATNISPAEFFAKKIDKAMGLLGNDLDAILRALTFEADDMENLKRFFLQRKKTDLAKTLKTECKGNLGNVLSGLVEK